MYLGLGVRSLLITSSLPSEGKSTISHALAKTATERGLRVLLIDADLRTVRGRPGISEEYLGLSDVIRGKVNVQEVMRTTSDLSFLPAGGPCEESDPAILASSGSAIAGNHL